MYALKWIGSEVLKKDLLIFDSNSIDLGSVEEFHFALLVISMILVAAAGYIINDILDVEEDEINKPKKLIISRHIQQREAQKTYWILNILAFLSSLYLDIFNKTLVFSLCIILLIFLLWLYSKQLKQRLLIGNIVVSIITASTAIITGLFIHIAIYPIFSEGTIYHDKLPKIYDGFWGISLFTFCMIFLLNLVREIIKDIEDLDGDKQVGAKTLPIRFGIVTSKIVCCFLLALFLTPFIYASDYPIRHLVIVGVLANILGIIFSKNKTHFSLNSAFLKVNMLFGLIFLISISL